MKTILLKSNINSGGGFENFAFTGVLRYSCANIDGYFYKTKRLIVFFAKTSVKKC